MPAYRKTTRISAVAAAGAVIFAGLTACHPAVSPEDATGPIKAISHDPAAASQLSPTISKLISEIPGVLRELNEATPGQVRDAIISTACDAFTQGDFDPNWEAGILRSLGEDIKPLEEQLLDSVRNLIATLDEDEQNGMTTADEIDLACQAYLTKGAVS